jgi:hypothetical protein
MNFSFTPGFSPVLNGRGLEMPRARPVDSRCHGLVPWSLTLVASSAALNLSLDATGLSRGVEMPRARPVESHACG